MKNGLTQVLKKLTISMKMILCFQMTINQNNTMMIQMKQMNQIKFNRNKKLSKRNLLKICLNKIIQDIQVFNNIKLKYNFYNLISLIKKEPVFCV